jgi:uncharacterized protein YdiU (UPF0061 family)
MKGMTQEWVREVARRNAKMVGLWQVYGYCHGVLNTDKCDFLCARGHAERDSISILGLTIDYGPYAFMDVFDEGHICSNVQASRSYFYADASRPL